ncbi:hypothetical protein ACFOUP_11155 [Belliella kenyensis]|uniref:Uncharacterized protein n=1 Tax=Belliella kenyensis TaxID=1472724 RepID=A0ABV8EKV3_9BACT|nr:hypothetical protein [Belliella kenyensis]MCH7403729.1 hypothetical protein [Belliella kenyensis]MDN3602482.1 hypothetical protein [Belliella kenyensis]
MNKINYLILDKDKSRVKKIKHALSSKRFNCLGVNASGLRLENKLEELNGEPDVFFIGDIKNFNAIVRVIEENFSNKGIVRVYDQYEPNMIMDGIGLRRNHFSYILIS